MKMVLSVCIGLVFYNFIIKPIETHKIQNNLIQKGYPKPNSYKKYIWF